MLCACATQNCECPLQIKMLRPANIILANADGVNTSKINHYLNAMCLGNHGGEEWGGQMGTRYGLKKNKNMR